MIIPVNPEILLKIIRAKSRYDHCHDNRLKPFISPVSKSLSGGNARERAITISRLPVIKVINFCLVVIRSVF